MRVEVEGNLEFTTISVGSTHACGLSAARVANCWGSNYFGPEQRRTRK